MPAPAITCPNCSRTYIIKPELLGKRVKCKCGERITFPDTLPTSDTPVPGKVPPVTTKPAGPPVQPPPGAPGNTDIIEEIGPMDLADAPTQVADTFPCGGCQQSIPVGTILCTHCGFNQRTGQRIATTVVRTRNAPPPKPQASAANYDDEVSGLDWVLILLCPGIACIIGLVRVIQGRSSGWTLIIAPFVIGAIGGVIGVVIGLMRGGAH